MSRKVFTEAEQQLLRQNPYIYSVTERRISLTKEFKEIFITAYQSGESPRKILAEHGFDIAIIGDRRVCSISQHVRAEYKKYGYFHEGTAPRSAPVVASSASPEALSVDEEIKLLRRELEYMKQELSFLKKVSSIRNTRK